jgi:hypothetical protein
MSNLGKHRRHLPQCDGKLFLTDGGIETTLIFLEGLELPHFAAFDLLRDRAGWDALRKYYERYVRIAIANRVGFVLESATWRASADWGDKLGYSKEALAHANRDGIALLVELRKKYDSQFTPMVISGCLGPRGDGYDPGTAMSVKQAEDYHAEQIAIFAVTEADMVSALTMTNVNEAIGLARPHRRPARQRFDERPCRAQRIDRARFRQPARARRPVPRPAQAAAEGHRPRRLLRHRPPPRRSDLHGVPGGVVVRCQRSGVRSQRSPPDFRLLASGIWSPPIPPSKAPICPGAVGCARIVTVF